MALCGITTCYVSGYFLSESSISSLKPNTCHFYSVFCTGKTTYALTLWLMLHWSIEIDIRFFQAVQFWVSPVVEFQSPGWALQERFSWCVLGVWSTLVVGAVRAVGQISWVDRSWWCGQTATTLWWLLYILYTILYILYTILWRSYSTTSGLLQGQPPSKSWQHTEGHIRLGCLVQTQCDRGAVYFSIQCWDLAGSDMPNPA